LIIKKPGEAHLTKIEYPIGIELSKANVIAFICSTWNIDHNLIDWPNHITIPKD